MDLEYILNQIKEANKYSIKIFNSLNKKKLKKSIYYSTEINEILTNLEIATQLEMEENNE